jgi:hypothetical protein
MPLSSSLVSSFGFGRRASDYPPNSTLDPFFSYVELLLHMDGVNGSTVFTDSSLRPKITTPFGGAQLSSNDFKFGGTSGYFNNTNAYLTVANDPGFNFSTSNWTVEFFCNIDPVESDILINKSTGFGFFPFQIRISGGRFNARGYASSGSLVYNLGASTGPLVSSSTWYYLALCRQGINFYFYIDGVLVESTQNSSALLNQATPISIAGLNNGQGLAGGYFDEIRITNGVCRYPNGLTFAVPTAPFFTPS